MDIITSPQMKGKFGPDFFENLLYNTLSFCVLTFINFSPKLRVLQQKHNPSFASIEKESRHVLSISLFTIAISYTRQFS